MKLERTFRFRAARDYLHSTSMLDDLLRTRGAAAFPIDMKFHLRTNQQVAYVDAPPAAGVPLVAEWSDAKGRLYVVPRGVTISEREPYDEPALVALLTRDGRSVDVPADIAGFSRCEAVIAGFKYLLEEARGRGVKYVFARIRLDALPQGAFRINYARDIGRFFQGDIVFDGQIHGQIFFGKWT